MTTYKTEVVASEGFTLSRIVWRLFKRHPRGYVERVLDENPGLAAHGPHIPVGTVIKLPLDDVPPASQEVEVVRLWD